MEERRLISAELVTEGHPDRICDLRAPLMNWIYCVLYILRQLHTGISGVVIQTSHGNVLTECKS
jgi:hypothetical protein